MMSTPPNTAASNRIQRTTHLCFKKAAHHDVFVFLLLVFILISTQMLASPPHVLWRLAYFPIFIIAFTMRNSFQNMLYRMNSKTRLNKILLSLVFIGALFRLAHALKKIIQPIKFIEDIATVYVKAIHLLFNFTSPQNPYSHSIDPYCWNTLSTGTQCYSGLKYTPLQLIIYAPAVSILGVQGIYLTHLFFYFFMAYILFRYLSHFSKQHASLGLITFFASEPISVLAFNNGSNDLIPTVWMMLSLLAIHKVQSSTPVDSTFIPSRYAGVFAGLSLLSKQLPAGLFFIYLFIHKKWSSLLMGLLIFLVGVLPFLIWDHTAFIDNVIFFNLNRPVRNSSIAYLLPQQYQQLFSFLGLVMTLVCFYFSKLKNYQSLNGLALGLIIFLITAKMSPFHYFLWVLPLIILVLLEPSPIGAAHESL